jgi:hypothetical protein
MPGQVREDPQHDHDQHVHHAGENLIERDVFCATPFVKADIATGGV